MNRVLAGWLAAHAPAGARWQSARRLPDAAGRGTPPRASVRAITWGRSRIIEHADPARGIFSDQATDLSARALLADRSLVAGKTVCETGCGTAALAALCGRLGAARVLATDCDGRALALARRTLRANNIPARLRRCDLLDGIPAPVDILIANLPQKPVPRGARLPLGQHGGPRGDAILARFLPQAARILPAGGRLYLFLHTLTPPATLARLASRFHVGIPFWRRRLVPPGEYPPAMTAEWLSRAARGAALFHPLPGRPGWHAFYCLLVAARRK